MGEFDLLRRVRERLPPDGPRVLLGSGDDASVTLPGGATATSVDALVEGVHFRRGEAGLESIGRKALATALSDLAAMGAGPGEAYVVLGVPADLDEDGCLALLDGMLELAAATGTTLAGGDVTRAPVLMLSTTVVGHAAAPGDFVGRAGARAGDALVVTGELGGAGAGLLLLEQDEAAQALAPEAAARLTARQLEPAPRLRAGRALAEAGATAMIDLSDGIAGDARHLAEASGVGLRIEVEALPLAGDLRDAASALGRDPLRLALSGGEDYELLAALPPEHVEEARSAVAAAEGVPLTRVGAVVAGEDVELRLPGGESLEASGFDQLG